MNIWWGKNFTRLQRVWRTRELLELKADIDRHNGLILGLPIYGSMRTIAAVPFLPRGYCDQMANFRFLFHVQVYILFLFQVSTYLSLTIEGLT